MTLTGKVYLLGDDINTDYIIAGKYRASAFDLKDMAKHVMEDIDPDFTKKISPGDWIVAGDNFGCGSSREYAPKVILEAGIRGIIARSFARIFYRNCINSGLLVVECDTSDFGQGDSIAVSLDSGVVRNETRSVSVNFPAIPMFMQNVLNEGGMVGYLKKHGKLDSKSLG